MHAFLFNDLAVCLAVHCLDCTPATDLNATHLFTAALFYAPCLHFYIQPAFIFNDLAAASYVIRPRFFNHYLPVFLFCFLFSGFPVRPGTAPTIVDRPTSHRQPSTRPAH